MPFKNSRFLGREDVLEELEQRLFLVNKIQQAAIFGLGGVGKTQLALAYCYTVKERHPDYSIFWVSALSTARFKYDYTKIAKKLNIGTGSTGDELIRIVQEYLSSEVAGKWLLIVDNSDDKTTLFDGHDCILNYLPQSEVGIILFTTRYKDIAVDLAGHDTVSLGEMELGEAMVFLQKSLGQDSLPQEEQPMNDLLKELTCLPLAIVQAASYINKNSIGVSQYLDLMRNSEEEMVKLLSRDFWDSTRERESRNPVALTWLVSFELIRHNEPSAAEILFQLAFLENKDIPQSILPNNGSEVDLTDAIGILVGYSFLTKSGNVKMEMYNMHRLVHRAIKIWMQKQGLREPWLARTISHLVDISSSSKWENREIWRKYIPHVIRVLQSTEIVHSEQRANLYVNLAGWFRIDERWSEAIKWQLESASWCRQSLFTDRSYLIMIETQLAWLYLENSQIAEALATIEAIQIRELPEDDPLQLRFQNALALVYQLSGRVKEAIEIMEKKIAVMTRASGEDSLNLLEAVQDLALIYLVDGQWGKAIETMEGIDPIMISAFAENGRTRIPFEELLVEAHLLDEQTEKAIEMYEKAITKITAFADDHPHRLAINDLLALMYSKNGRPGEAVEVEEKVVEASISAFGDDHPRTRRYKDNLAAYRDEYRRVKEDVKETEVEMTDTRVLAEDYPGHLKS